MKIDHEKMTAEINLMKKATYYVVDGEAKKVDDCRRVLLAEYCLAAWEAHWIRHTLHKEKQMTKY